MKVIAMDAALAVEAHVPPQTLKCTMVLILEESS
jgi:hypothetical protein